MPARTGWDDAGLETRAELACLFERTAVAAGDDFFKVLVGQLAATLRVAFVLASECVEPPPAAPSHVRTVALWVGQRLTANVEYALSGTPCEDVLGGECRGYTQNLQALFPADAWLQEMRVESYVAVPLVGAEGGVVGHLAAMDQQPIEDLDVKREILGRFAPRCAAEMARRRREVECARLVTELSMRRTLHGLITLCAWCGHVRDHQEWGELASYVQRHSDAGFTHGICPECRERMASEVQRPADTR